MTINMYILHFKQLVSGLFFKENCVWADWYIEYGASLHTTPMQFTYLPSVVIHTSLMWRDVQTVMLVSVSINTLSVQWGILPQESPEPSIPHSISVNCPKIETRQSGKTNIYFTLIPARKKALDCCNDLLSVDEMWYKVECMEHSMRIKITAQS